jgi:osmotically-inducible protein OsmY
LLIIGYPQSLREAIMISALFYRPLAVLAKAALVGDARKRFGNVVVENGHGTVVLRGSVSDLRSASEAHQIAANATGSFVVNQLQVMS